MYDAKIIVLRNRFTFGIVLSVSRVQVDSYLVKLGEGPKTR